MAGVDDWNIRSKLYVVNGDNNSPSHPGIVYIDHPGTKPATYDEVKVFIDDHDLKLGDVVRFGYHRDTDSVIVAPVTDGGQLHFIRNPDDSGAGYLTIPTKVLRYIKDGPRKYADILANVPMLNLHLSATDEFIVTKLGGLPPVGTQFDVHYVGGFMESINVKLPESDLWREFEPDDVTLVRLNRLLEELNHAPSSRGNASLAVRVSLRSDQFMRYKDMHSQAGRKHAWLQAVPSLPESWIIEKGTSAMGSTSAAWIWKMQGPALGLAEVKRSVGEFLQGFYFEYVGSSDTLDTSDQ